MRLITAIGNPYINEKLRKMKNCEVIGTDIQYQEGIIEALEEKQDIDIIILSNILPKEYDLNILINKIKAIKENIEIIVFLSNKDEDTERYLNSKNIYKIYYLNDYDAFFYNFQTNFEESNEDVSKEISDFKKIIVKTNYSNNEVSELEVENKIISISGSFGVGKSIVSSILSNVISMENQKVLLIDFDVFNSSINTIFGMKKYPKNANAQDIESLIIRINKNLDIIFRNRLYFL